MSLLLRIKLKALAFQSRELRREENLALAHARVGNQDAEGAREILHHIRTGKLRQEARAANLAYGFLRGRPYYIMEDTCNEAPNFERVKEVILAYAWDDPRIIKQKFAEWLDDARDYLGYWPPKSTISYLNPPKITAKASEAMQKYKGIQQKKKPFYEEMEVVIVTNIDLASIFNGGDSMDSPHGLYGLNSLLKGAARA